jgi:hypothetical protein
MNAHASITLPAIGAAFEGGFFAGRFALDGKVYALIVSPKAQGEHDDIAYGEYGQEIAGAGSFNDGMDNTIAMADAGSEMAHWALNLNIDGHTDWYIPSRDELELLYRNLKPTTHSNYVYRHGENPSSVPVGYPYTEESPAQASVDAFQEGGDEAFEGEWYWSSSQFSADYAWYQYFYDGYQNYYDKLYEFRARAVRRLIIQ